MYSCATCSKGSKKEAAICLACSLECHDNHEVYELYTKRNYRCDCGNSKFDSNFVCKLIEKDQKKSPINEKNKYNHNFSGRYCTCDKRYPPEENDDSAESNDEMWQCVVCEDWYHSKHLGANELPAKFEELVCGSCVEDLDFVHYYYKTADMNGSLKSSESATTPSASQKPESDLTTQVTSEAISSTEVDVKTGSSVNGETVGDEKSKEATTICESDTNDSQAENKDPDHGKSSNQTKSECILDSLKKEYESNEAENPKCSSETREKQSRNPLFWSDCTWRSKLCRCQKCLDMYKAKDCEYLLDEKDTVQYYEAQGKVMAKDSQSPMERGMSALNRMNRAAVVEALHGYDELKADLSEYLRKFADTKKVVREEDIHEFFQQLKSKKRQKLEYPEG